MGVDFYRRAMELQEKYPQAGYDFREHHANERYLLNDEWCEFFVRTTFSSVSVSTVLATPRCAPGGSTREANI